MECFFCGRDLSNDSRIKVASAASRDGEGNETVNLCDGPGESALDAHNLHITAVIPNDEEKKYVSNHRLCAQVYKYKKVMLDGMMVNINVREK